MEIIQKYYTDTEMKRRTGSFISKDDYDIIISDNCDVFYINDEGKDQLLCSFRKNAIPKYIQERSYNILYPHAKKNKTSMRGYASGTLNKNMLSKNVDKILEPDNFKSKIQFKNGSISNYKVSNIVHSFIIGYYEKKLYGSSLNNDYQTAWIRHNPKEYELLKELTTYLSKCYKKVYEDGYQDQKRLCEKIDKYIISESIFSTLTINYNWRTAIHLDSGDYSKGYSVFTVLESGKWEGGYLCFPQFRIAIDVRGGDFLLFDPHQYHCNDEINIGKDGVRLSIVAYVREGLYDKGD